MIDPQENAVVAVPGGAWQLDIESELPSTEEAVDEVREHRPLSKGRNPVSETPPPLGRILEAMLFAAPQALSAEKLIGILRGLTPALLEETVRELNIRYHRQGRPYTIVTNGEGYQLLLRSKFRQHLESLYGGVKEVRLSPSLVETLAVVAYRQPVNQVGVEAILGQECSGLLRQLVRRGLVEIQGKDENNLPLYSTTRRFLEFFGLDKVDDLPRADDMERL